MTTNTSLNQKYQNNADGFEIAGGTTPRKLIFAGGDVTLESAGNYTLAVSGNASISGDNTGDQNLSTYAPLDNPVFTGTIQVSAVKMDTGASDGYVMTSDAAGVGRWIAPSGGTVTDVSVVATNGVSGVVSNPTTTPAITLSLGAITPSSVNELTLAKQTVGFTIAGGDTSKTLTVPLDASVSGTNTGDNAVNTSSLSLDQTTPQTVINGIPLLDPNHADFTLDHQIIDKEYADSLAGGGMKSWFFTKTASDVGGMYKATIVLPTGGLQTISVSAPSGETTLATFLSEIQVSQHRVTDGSRFFYVEGKTNSTHTDEIQLKGYVYITDISGGSDVLVGTTNLSPFLTDSDSLISFNYWGISRVILATERIKFVIKAVSLGKHAHDVILSLEDNTFSRFDVPSPVGVTDLSGVLHLDQTTHQHVINGQPVFDTGIQVGSTSSTFAESKVYWDSTFKTLAVESGSGTGHEKTLQVGQEEWRMVTNNTGTDIAAGVLVYTVSAASGLATIAKAQGNMQSTSQVLGMTTEIIHNGASGMVTIRGNVNNVNTEKIDAAYLLSQGILYHSKAYGTAGNAYKVVVSAGGSLAYTEDATTITITLGGTSATTADVVALFTATPSALCNVREITSGDVFALAAQDLAGGIVISEGQVLYLSPFIDGMATTVQPSTPNYDVRIGRLMTKHATTGRINVRIIPAYSLDSLTDVTAPTPTLDDLLKFNGTQWVNAPAGSASVDVGISFYMDDTVILPLVTNQNVNEVCTLSKTPITATATVVDSIALNGTQTLLGEAYLYNTALAKTVINAGTWNFSTYCRATNSSRGSILRYVYQVIPNGTGITFTTSGGAGTSRTVTISDTTSTFIAGDASSTLTVGGYFQTEVGLYKITAVTNAYTATILVPTNYTNESTKTFKVWRNLFGVNTGLITNTTTGSYSLIANTSIQSDFTIAATDMIGEIVFGTSTNNVTVYWTHNGTSTYSNFRTPLVLAHNDLAGLQGGSATERNHLTNAQVSALHGVNDANSSSLPIGGGTLTGNLLFTDNTLDIGASGATRPRTGYFGTSVITPAVKITTGAGANKLLKSDADGLASWETVVIPSGTVTEVSVATANGVSGTVATSTTTPAITLALGAITPSSVNGNTITTGTGTLTLSTYTLTVANTASISGTNTGDNTIATDLTGTPSVTVANVITTGYLELGHASDTTIRRVSAGLVSIEGANIMTVSSADTVTGVKTLGTTGAVKLGSAVTDKCDIQLNNSALNDETWSGTVIAAVAGSAIVVGDLVMLATDGKWDLTDGILDGTDVSFKSKIGICLVSANDTNATKILLDGVFASATLPTLTVGAPVYMSDTAGDVVIAQPTTTNFAIRVIGEALSTTVMHFHPSNDYIIHI